MTVHISGRFSTWDQALKLITTLMSQHFRSDATNIEYRVQLTFEYASHLQLLGESVWTGSLETSALHDNCYSPVFGINLSVLG